MDVALTLQDITMHRTISSFSWMDKPLVAVEPETFIVVGDADEGSNLFLIVGIVIGALFSSVVWGTSSSNSKILRKKALHRETQGRKTHMLGDEEAARFLNNNLLLFQYNQLSQVLCSAPRMALGPRGQPVGS